MAPRRPFVTLAYAQSLDGSLAAAPGQRLALSGPESATHTHRLRAAHDAILVGIGTVLADDPRLTVRLASGANPQPVVVDSQLRCPLDAALLSHPTHRPWIATTVAAPAQRRAALSAAGAVIIFVKADPSGRVDVARLLDALGERGVGRLMVEGGAAILTTFLVQHLADTLNVTIAPRLIGGVRALQAPASSPVRDPVWRMAGSDMIFEARISDREDA